MQLVLDVSISETNSKRNVSRKIGVFFFVLQFAELRSDENRYILLYAKWDTAALSEWLVHCIYRKGELNDAIPESKTGVKAIAA